MLCIFLLIWTNKYIEIKIINKEFIINDNTIIEYVGPGGNVIIPQNITDIFFEAFYASTLITSITIPGSILDITPFVFEKCKNLK